MSKLFLLVPIMIVGTYWSSVVRGLKQVEVVTIGYINTGVPSSLGQLAPAYDAAAARFGLEHGRNFNLTHTYLVNITINNCPDYTSQATFAISEWYYKKRTKADIFACIAPNTDMVLKMVRTVVCLEFAEVNRLLASWDILLISTAVDDPLLRNKAVTPTALTVSMGTFDTLLGMYVASLAYFQWTTVVIIFDQSALPGLQAMAALIVPYLRERHWQVTMYRVTSKISMDFTKELLNFRLVSRVLIFISHAQPFRQFMIQASRLGMCTGEYVYIAFVVYKHKVMGDMTWRYGDDDDAIAREAFRSVLVVGPDPFVYALPDRTMLSSMTAGYFSTALNLSFPELDPAIPQVSAVVAAFSLLGKVLEDSLNGSSPEDNPGGRQLAQRLLGRSWDLGYVEMTLDEYGQRMTHEEMSDMDPITGEFKPVLQLQFTKPKTVLKLSDIDWGAPVNSSNTVPLNVPVCGYRGDRGPCVERSQLLKPAEVAVVASVLSVLFICISLAFFYYGRRRRQNFTDFEILINEIKLRDPKERRSQLRSSMLG